MASAFAAVETAAYKSAPSGRDSGSTEAEAGRIPADCFTLRFKNVNPKTCVGARKGGPYKGLLASLTIRLARYSA
jgi:hypothetical protein